MSKTPRAGFTFTLIELLVVIAIIGILARPFAAGRAVGTRGRPAYFAALNNLKQCGLALQNYHSSHNTFPASKFFRGSDTYAGANTMLLPYFEEESLRSFMTPRSPGKTSGRMSRALVWVLDCPSTFEPNPLLHELLGTVVDNAVFGTTDYAYCKGISDARCLQLGEGGLEPYPSRASARHVRPAVGGCNPPNHRWHQQDDRNGRRQWRSQVAGLSRCGMHGCRIQARRERQSPLAWAGWIITEPNSTPFYNGGLIAAGVFACTMEPLNKYPVTDTYIRTGRLADPLCSQVPKVPAISTSDFRSDDPGGGNLPWPTHQ